MIIAKKTKRVTNNSKKPKHYVTESGLREKQIDRVQKNCPHSSSKLKQFVSILILSAWTEMWRTVRKVHPDLENTQYLANNSELQL